MARPQRNNVDYFPHSVIHGKKMYYLRSKYKNDGYAVWFMLLEELGKANYHYLNLSDDVQLMYLSSEFMVAENILKDIINILVKLGEFDEELWDQESILFNSKFVESVDDAYSKRNNKCITRNELIRYLHDKGELKLIKSNLLPNKRPIKVVNNPQSKVEDSIEKETKERDPVFENSILKFFGFSETTNFNHARTVHEFITVIESQNKLDYFKEQFTAYCEVKKEGYKHSLKNFLGDQTERFENGAWDSENWSIKLKSNQPQNTNTSTGFVIGQKHNAAG